MKSDLTWFYDEVLGRMFPGNVNVFYGDVIELMRRAMMATMIYARSLGLVQWSTTHRATSGMAKTLG